MARGTAGTGTKSKLKLHRLKGLPKFHSWKKPSDGQDTADFRS
jgi:hypothetical protein